MTDLPTSVFGLMSLIIVTLSGVVARLWKSNMNLNEQINQIQSQRVTDALETRDKVAIPLQQIAQYSELTYNKLLQGSTSNKT